MPIPGRTAGRGDRGCRRAPPRSPRPRPASRNGRHGSGHRVIVLVPIHVDDDSIERADTRHGLTIADSSTTRRIADLVQDAAFAVVTDSDCWPSYRKPAVPHNDADSEPIGAAPSAPPTARRSSGSAVSFFPRPGFRCLSSLAPQPAAWDPGRAAIEFLVPGSEATRLRGSDFPAARRRVPPGNSWSTCSRTRVRWVRAEGRLPDGSRPCPLRTGA